MRHVDDPLGAVLADHDSACNGGGASCMLYTRAVCQRLELRYTSLTSSVAASTP
jgi:hypothetical protein